MSFPRIYFLNAAEPDNLQDDMIGLAEGLRDLGIPYHARHTYWRLHPDREEWLFKASPEVDPRDCDIVVHACTYYRWVKMRSFELVERPLPPELFQPERRHKNVLLDFLDGHATLSWRPEFRAFDLILRAKLNQRAWYPENLRPWALNLSHRVIDSTAGGMPWPQRRRECLVNFGASHPYPHGSRDKAEARFHPELARVMPLNRSKDDLTVPPTDPGDHLMWIQTGGRFSRAYYDRLKSAQVVSCFCGDFVPPLPWKSPGKLLLGGNKAKLRRAFYTTLGRLDPRPDRIVQWDSFRFWETLCAGAVALHVDLERHGVALPVMPENGTHYLGVDLDRPQAALERLSDDPAGLAAIAAAGRAWALEHYSPPALAQRFLKLF